jgi:hypothetical protein
MAYNPKENKQQVRTVRFLPQDLECEPAFPKDMKLAPDLCACLVNLFGQTSDGGRLIAAFPWNALKVSAYGSGYTYYDTKSGSQPSAFSSTHELAAASGRWHRVDVLVETQEAEIRFYLDDLGEWGDAVPLPVGYHSLEFSTSKVQVKYRTATGGTYVIVGYQ